MMATHTPGPWYVGYLKGQDETPYILREVSKDGSKIIARADHYVWPEGVGLANALLIAKAPELKEQRDALLAASQAALEYFEEIEWQNAGGKWYEDVTAQLRAAIQAAEEV